MSTVSVMYNGCYGGFEFSKEAIDEYNRRKPAGSSALTASTSYNLSRADPLMAQICKEMGPSASGQFSDILIKNIPAKFGNCFCIKEYDGMEWVSISFGKYQLDCIRLIMSTETMSNDEKLRMIALTLDEPKTDCDTTDDDEESPSLKQERDVLPDVGSMQLHS